MSKQSIEAFITQIKSGSMKTRRHEIYMHLMKTGGKNLDDLRNYMAHIPHQTLTSAVSFMMDEGLVRQEESGIFSVVWETEEIRNLGSKRAKAKFDKWVKKGEEKGYFMRRASEAIRLSGL